MNEELIVDNGVEDIDVNVDDNVQNEHNDIPPSDQQIEIPTMKVQPLKKICMTIGEIPTSYLETMSYYEMLVWFIHFLRDTVIPTVNNNGEAVQEVQTIVMNLQNYINTYKETLDQEMDDFQEAVNNDIISLEDYMNNYFNNLDVQEEINNKLDDMLEDGVLEQIIEQYIQSTAVWCFDTIADMKLATNLINGSFTQTLGYHAKNDGGASLYKIRTKTNDDVIDEGSLVAVYDDTLVAEIVVQENQVNPNQFGAYGDNTHDDSTAIQNAINFAQTKGFKDVLLINEKYYCESGLVITSPEFKLHGVPMTEYGCGIRFKTDVSVGIDVQSYGFRMDNVCLSTTKASTNTVLGLRLVRPTGTGTNDEIEEAMNIDADITHCAFLWLHKSILTKGRNVNVDTCEFGECDNGFELDYVATGHSHRDIWIRNCRFHNIGAYLRETVGYSYGIAIKFPDGWNRTDIYGNIIRNNFFDYCNNVFVGCILGCTISDNNILDCLHDAIVAINPNDTTINSNNNIEILISNNNINIRGNDSRYGIYIKGAGRPRITGNLINNQPTIAVYLEKCSTIWFTNNVLNCIRSDITENLKIVGSSGDEVFLADNMFASFQNANNTYVNISGVSKIFSGGNVQIGSSTAIVTNVTPYKQGEESHFW